MNPETPNYNPYEILCLQPTGLPASSCRSHENGEKEINKWFIKHIDHITAKRKNEPKELVRINALKDFLYQNNHSEVHSRLNRLRQKYNINNSSLSWTCCDPLERAAERFGVTTATLSQTLGSTNLQEAEKNYMWDLSTMYAYEEVLEVFHTCKSIDDRWYKVKEIVSGLPERHGNSRNPIEIEDAPRTSLEKSVTNDTTIISGVSSHTFRPTDTIADGDRTMSQPRNMLSTSSKYLEGGKRHVSPPSSVVATKETRTMNDLQKVNNSDLTSPQCLQLPREQFCRESLAGILKVLDAFMQRKHIIVSHSTELRTAGRDSVALVPVRFDKCCSAICAIKANEKEIFFFVHDHPSAEVHLREWLHPHIALEGWRSQTITEPHRQIHREGEVTITAGSTLTIAALLFQHSICRTSQGRDTPCWRMFCDFLFGSEYRSDGFAKRRLCERSGTLEPNDVCEPVELSNLCSRMFQESSRCIDGCHNCVTEMAFYLGSMPSDRLQWLRARILEYERLNSESKVLLGTAKDKISKSMEAWRWRLGTGA